jgi:hypothetical protein
MSTTPTTPKLPGPATAPLRVRPPAARPRARELLRGHPLALALSAALALAALSLLYPSTPSYDPWAWIQWGRDIVQLELNTKTGPSWKPLPVLFTAPFSLFGGAAPDLWLVVARAGGLLALLMCFRLAGRMVGRGPAAWAAGAIAAAGLLLSTYWLRNTMMGYSEGLLIALVLFAVERHLDDHHGQAFALGFGAALLRPEVWPFLGLYGLWLMWREPEHRRLVVGLGFMTVFLWLAPEWWGSGQPLRAASRAQEVVGGPALSDNPAVELLKRARTLVLSPVKAGILAALAYSAWVVLHRRHLPLALWMAAAAAAWVGIVAVMTQGGFAGNERYLAVPVALGCVLAGAGWVWLASALGRIGARAVPSAARVAGPVAGLVLLAAAVPFAIPRIDQLSNDDQVLRFEAQLRDQLATAVREYGGRDRALACGAPYAGAYNVAMVSWYLDVPGERVDYQTWLPDAPPGVAFRARSREGVNPTPPVTKDWKPVVHQGEWTILEACGPAGPGTRPRDPNRR